MVKNLERLDEELLTNNQILKMKKTFTSFGIGNITELCFFSSSLSC